MDATFDHVLPLAQSRMPASLGKWRTLTSQFIIGFTFLLANVVDTVVRDCLDLNIAEQLC